MSALCHSRPKCSAAKRGLFDDLVGASKQRRRHVEAERLAGPETDDVSYLVVACTGRSTRLLAFTYALNVTGRTSRRVRPNEGLTTQYRASRIMLSGVSAARRTRVKPPALITSASFICPACAPSAMPTSCDRDTGTQTMVENA
jgi:hypothetical protein